VCQQVSDGHGAVDDAVLQHDAEHQEQEVEQEHDEAQQAAHPPTARRDGDDDEEEHEEEQHDGAEQAVGSDGDGLAVVRQRVQQPGDGQAGGVGNKKEVSYSFQNHCTALLYMHIVFS